MELADDVTHYFRLAASYCSLQERSKWEVHQKLRSKGASNKTIEEVVKQLEQQGFLNEKRFAQEFTQGKFNQLKWGRTKIRHHLMEHRIPASIIGAALSMLDETAYAQTLQRLAEQHLKRSIESADFNEKVKTYRYLLSKGFESEHIKQALLLDA